MGIARELLKSNSGRPEAFCTSGGIAGKAGASERILTAASLKAVTSTPNMTLLNPSFAEDVARSFAQQPIMNLIGARLSLVGPGVVEITLPYRANLAQQHGYLHAGVVTTIADSACGYAAFTLMSADSNVLSVEFKVNLLRPAQGVGFVARAE